MFYSSRMTCRHFRYEVPSECADELRDADPEPCPVCDVLPHRQAMAVKAVVSTGVERVGPVRVARAGWFARLMGRREEIIPALPVPARAAV